ncbi:HNH endonuclease [Candidatus Peregrinibacteria bacterium]|nr:HNH endonuclease [Candidatus Peregrinibacteria bacterium]
MEKITENQAGSIDLHREFRKLTFDIHKMKNRLMMLLLEIYEQEIYKKHNCTTIYEYAFKYAKLSKETVQLALRTLRNTEDKPLLRAQIESKGIYKVAIVAKLATPETEKFYAGHVQKMRKEVLFAFAKEVRKSENEVGNVKFEAKCYAVVPKVSIELDAEMQTIFNQLKKEYGKDLSNKEALRVILKKLKENENAKSKNVPKNVPPQVNPRTEMQSTSQEIEVDFIPGNGISIENQISKISSANTTPQTQKTTQSSDALLPAQPPKFPSHTIPRETKREIDIKQNHKCAYPNCVKSIENYHHKIPFSFSRSHESLVGLCKTHHEFCHHGIIRHELDEPNHWRLNIKPARSQFDNFFLKYKAHEKNSPAARVPFPKKPHSKNPAHPAPFDQPNLQPYAQALAQLP